MRRLILLGAAALLAACANSGTGDVPPKTVDKVDLKRYQGVWYEQARLPMFFQRNCAQSEALYELQSDGSVGVTNTCITYKGEQQQAKGRAVLQSPDDSSKLWVSFGDGILSSLSKGHYWVLYLDHDYKTVLVGTPDRDNLWLLTRDKTMTAEQRSKLLDEATRRDYDTSKLIWRSSDASLGL
ncbi:lipocalin family protein [Ectopseudomonas mendocina]|uniref:Outer membrane lipoprotein Blc n=1 Tax=Ectopseudomonas mendocina TaxID=300 RepID=A0ABZ2RM37_ECTME